jgi:hypothetical protein
MVIKDCLALANRVSPQTPKSFLSWIMLPEISLLRRCKEEKKNLRRNEAIYGQGLDGCISVNRKQVFIERRIDTNDVLYLMIHLELQRIHG